MHMLLCCMDKEVIEEEQQPGADKEQPITVDRQVEDSVSRQSTRRLHDKHNMITVISYATKDITLTSAHY